MDLVDPWLRAHPFHSRAVVSMVGLIDEGIIGLDAVVTLCG